MMWTEDDGGERARARFDGAMRSSSSWLVILLNRAPSLSLQGHIFAAASIGDVYFWGKGVAVDYPGAMAAYEIGAEAGNAFSQYQVGMMYDNGKGVAVDSQRWYKPALPCAREGRGSRSA